MESSATAMEFCLSLPAGEKGAPASCGSILAPASTSGCQKYPHGAHRALTGCGRRAKQTLSSELHKNHTKPSNPSANPAAPPSEYFQDLTTFAPSTAPPGPGCRSCLDHLRSNSWFSLVLPPRPSASSLRQQQEPVRPKSDLVTSQLRTAPQLPPHGGTVEALQ